MSAELSRLRQLRHWSKLSPTLRLRYAPEIRALEARLGDVAQEPAEVAIAPPSLFCRIERAHEGAVALRRQRC